MSRPILLLDVDGVLAPWDSGLGFDQDVFWHHEAANIHMRRDLHEIIAKLDVIVELQWGTAWEREANVHILEHLGLTNPLPYLEFSNYEDLGETIVKLVEKEDHYHVIHGGISSDTWKLPWIERFCRQNPDRPIAWIDDEIGQDAMDFADLRREPTLFIRTDPNKGLEHEHVEIVKEWLEGECVEWVGG